MMLTLRGPNIYTESGIVNEISISAGKIVASNLNAEVLAFPDSYTVVPGFIDLHVHGMKGVDVMDGSQEALQQLRQALLQQGTTSFLATTMSADLSTLDNVLKQVAISQQNNNGANLLGVHLEGPFIAKSRVGAQKPEHVIPPDVSVLKKWQSEFPNLIKLVTLAPESSGAEALIEYLCAQKIIVAAGHTDASYEEGQTALEHGVSYVTHLFNAMRVLHHREPGLAAAALLHPDTMVELIADGIHLHPGMLNLALRLKSADNIILVTDAMRAACMHDGCYELGEQAVTVRAGQARLADGTLAGSTLTMPQVFKNILRFTSCSVSDAIKMCCWNPAKLLGVDNYKGSISEGKDADLVVLDENYNLVATICGGVNLTSSSLPSFSPVL